MKLFFIFIISLLPLLSFSQKSEDEVVVYGLDAIASKKKLSQIEFKTVKTNAEIVRIQLMKEGYLTCNVDSLIINDSLQTAEVYFYLGPKYDFAELDLDEFTSQALQETEGEEYWRRKINGNPKNISKLFETVLSYYENNGYPFVSIKIENPSWDGNVLLGEIITSTSKLVKVREIKIKSEDDIDANLLTNIIAIKEGDLFSMNKLIRIDNEIKELPFYTMTAPVEYEFVNNKVDIYIYLKKKNANSFNAILGVLPNDNGKINITGDVKIKLQNVLNKGEVFDFNWRKLLPLTQNLNIRFKYPYLFKSDFGINSKFDLYKKDTSYLDLNTRIGVVYAISSQLRLNIFYNNKSSSLLSTEKYEFVTSLPAFADVRTNSYGLNLEFENLNYLYNPVNGWDVNIEAAIGDKLIKKNIGLNPELYDGLTLRSLQFNIYGQIQKFIKFKKRSTFMIGAQGGLLLSENVFENELYRIGGQRTIRGFDDESIFASSYAIGTLEYRFILEENSNVFLFYQQMYYEKKVFDSLSQDTPYSFGLGINFQTKPGIFSISYSLGSQLDNPILLRSAKIHFGFVNYF